MAHADRVKFVDSLRFFAAAMVLLQHFLERRSDSLSLAIVDFGPGVAGVALFFFLSGFIIPYSVARGFNPIDFAVRRVTRIYPLYLFVLGLIALDPVFGLGVGDGTEFSGLDWLMAIPMLSEFAGTLPIIGVAWTLPLEFAWYFLFALFVTCFDTNVARRLELMMIATVLAALAISATFDLRIPAGRLFMLYATVIGYKSYLYVSEQLPLRSFLLTLAVFFALLLPSYYLSFSVFRHENIPFAEALLPWLTSAGIFLLVVLMPRMRTSPIFCNPLFSYLGAISYSVYLTHAAVYRALASRFGEEHILVPALVATLVASSFTYRLIELNGIKLGQHLSRQFRHRAEMKGLNRT